MIRPTLANHLWHAAAGRSHRKFRKATSQPAATQWQLLSRLVREHAGTAFGQAHHFDRIQAPGEFQEAVPLSNYEDYEPFIDRIARGESMVLTPQPVTHFVPTSGSTSGRKLIPWTTGLQADFNHAIDPWVSDLFNSNPDLKRGRAYWAVSPAAPEEQDPRSRVPVGLEDDTEYLGEIAGRIIRNVMAVPSAVRHVWDTDTFRYLVLLHLAAARDLRLVSIWHPTFLTLLLDALPNHFEAIVRSLRDGRISPPGDLPAHLQRQFQARFRKDARRARELSRLDPRQPEALWPHLQLLSAWGDAPSPEREALTSRFPNTRFQPKGLLATEAVVSIPFAGREPLAITSHFFEFIDPGGDILLAHQLEQGSTYEVVVTTSGGLYRYRLRDQVEVVETFNQTPCLRFLGRCGNVSDMRGEKLDERFVGEILNALGKDLVGCRFQLLAREEEPPAPRYHLLLVADDPVDLGSLATSLENRLCQNPHYRLCRFLGQLEPVIASRTTAASIDRYFTWRSAAGIKIGDLKPTFIDSGPGLLDCFEISRSSGLQSPSSGIETP